MKVYIFTDLEGVGGVLYWHQVFKDQDRAAYEHSCRLLAAEVNAAVEGALQGGADEVVVWDGHAAQFNLPLDALHPDAVYVMGAPTPELFPLISEGADAAFLVGYHAMAGTPGAVLAHTWSTDGQRLRINGREMGEIGLCAAYAGWYGVPVLMVSGDDKACTEARELLGDVETAVVKQALSMHSAVVTPPQRCPALVQEAAVRAMARAGTVPPFRIDPPYRVEITYPDREGPWARSHPPGVERVDDRTVAVTGEDLVRCLERLYRGE
ncbi:MAG: M55 family metallopeptidase [Anaerolineae bacterium]|jgi:D-amino peptidase